MNASKNRWTQQEKTNQPAADDEIVDLSATEEQMVDQPIVREQVVRTPTAVAQSRDRPVEVTRTKQAVPPEEQEFADLPCPQCASLLPANASFCSHCGVSLVAFKPQRPVPQNKAPSLGKGPSAKPPKKGRVSRGKLLWIGLAGIVAVSVAFGIFSQTSGNGAVDTRGSSIPRATPVTSAPAVPPAGTPGTTAGALVAGVARGVLEPLVSTAPLPDVWLTIPNATETATIPTSPIHNSFPRLMRPFFGGFAGAPFPGDGAMF